MIIQKYFISNYKTYRLNTTRESTEHTRSRVFRTCDVRSLDGRTLTLYITFHHNAERILYQTNRRLTWLAAVLVVQLTTVEENLTSINKLNLSLLCSMEYSSYILSSWRRIIFLPICLGLLQSPGLLKYRWVESLIKSVGRWRVQKGSALRLAEEKVKRTPNEGLEPSTIRLRAWRSTDWASPAVVMTWRRNT